MLVDTDDFDAVEAVRSLISTRRPSSSTALLAVSHDTASASATRAIVRCCTTMACNAQRSAVRDSQLAVRPPPSVLTPHPRTVPAAEATDRHQQRRRTPPERLMRQASGHRVTRHSFATATTAPAVELARLDPARQHRPVGFDTLPDNLRPELVKATEHAKVRAHEGSVNHVEVFRLGSVRTPIIGRPRPYPGTDAPAATPRSGRAG